MYVVYISVFVGGERGQLGSKMGSTFWEGADGGLVYISGGRRGAWAHVREGWCVSLGASAWGRMGDVLGDELPVWW